MRIKNQIIIEWNIVRVYEDFSFEKVLDEAINGLDHPIKENERLEIHQIAYVGEFNNEKVYLIILNILQQ